MMPIFFNIESHLWIFALFIFNGLLATSLLRIYSGSFEVLTRSFESQVLSSFFISLTINSSILLVLSYMSLPFSKAYMPLVLICIALSLGLALSLRKGASVKTLFDVDFGFLRLGLYALTFILLFYNGAYIEQISDAWWHISLANKIGLESTFSPSVGHLTGLPTRYYPPLWHGNLALSSLLSGIDISIFWNSLTAWVAVFKVMAIYLIAQSFTKQRSIGLIAAALFVLLPGVGTSYLRVSAWPSHIAYTAWFALFYLTSNLLDSLPKDDADLFTSIKSVIKESKAALLGFPVLAVLIFYTHQAEVLWFAVACFAYCAAGSLSRNISSLNEFIVDRDNILIRLVYRFLLLALLAYASYFAFTQDYPSWGFSDHVLSNSVPILVLFILAVLEFSNMHLLLNRIQVIAILVIVLAAVNYQQFVSLFFSDLSLPKGQIYTASTVGIGYFGGELRLPSWNLQLRSGLLYSGVLGVLASVFLVAIRPTRASFLVAGTSCLAFVFFVSPYFYHWLQSILNNYHSPWRISIIIFHPIIWAMVLSSLWVNVRASK